MCTVGDINVVFGSCKRFCLYQILVPVILNHILVTNIQCSCHTWMAGMRIAWTVDKGNEDMWRWTSSLVSSVHSHLPVRLTFGLTVEPTHPLSIWPHLVVPVKTILLLLAAIDLCTYWLPDNYIFTKKHKLLYKIQNSLAMWKYRSAFPQITNVLLFQNMYHIFLSNVSYISENLWVWQRGTATTVRMWLS